ncbi:hypothetical protein K3495_g8170 [Podosphaera aphanis]|nr:hypothetical protein K3495_g8170 [Podosphaera aphanis]
MSSPAPTQRRALGNCLVVGGCGFLGHHIVNELHRAYDCRISVLDLHTTRNRHAAADYFEGDITSSESLLKIFQKVRPDIVIHTASPTLIDGTPELYIKVNIDGTRCVIDACQKSNVKALIYTSSASIISDNKSDLVNADERWPITPAESQTEFYSWTKAEAESLVLAANRSTSYPSLLTCSLRPAGIFGEGDVQLIPNVLNVYYSSKTGFQLGSNTNLFDFTYVGNVAQAHCLAAAALSTTSQLTTAPLAHEKVDGEAFFITNNQPVYFWDFTRAVWKVAGWDSGTEHVWEISRTSGMLIGAILEWGMWAIGRVPKLTRRQVRYSCMVRYYDCTKAKKLLGYEPQFDLQEGIERSVRWFEDQKKANSTKAA